MSERWDLERVGSTFRRDDGWTARSLGCGFEIRNPKGEFIDLIDTTDPLAAMAAADKKAAEE